MPNGQLTYNPYLTYSQYRTGCYNYFNYMIKYGLMDVYEAERRLRAAQRTVEREGLSTASPYYQSALGHYQSSLIPKPAPPPSFEQYAYTTPPVGRVIPREIEPAKDVSEIYYPFLTSKLPSNIASYFESELPTIYAKFKEEHPGEREKWLTKRQEQEPVPSMTPDESTGYAIQRAREGWERKAELAEMGVVSQSSAERAKRDYDRILAEHGGGVEKAPHEWFPTLPPVPPKPPPPDPWEEYLKNYPWLQEYYIQPARKRGEYPEQFRPPTRWL